MLGDDDFGKDRSSYGEFRCSHCKRKWTSTRVWNGYGQICKNCDTVVYPTNLSKNYVYICHKCGDFWHSSYSATGKECKHCRANIKIFPLDPDDFEDKKIIAAHHTNISNGTIHINQNGEHKQDLCLKCKAIGRPCREWTTEHTTTLPSGTSQVRKRCIFIPYDCVKLFLEFKLRKKYQQCITTCSTSRENIELWNKISYQYQY